MKRKTLRIAFWVMKIFVILSYFEIILPKQLFFILVAIGGIVGLLTLLWPQVSKRDTKFVKRSFYWTLPFMILWFIFSPIMFSLIVSLNFGDIILVSVMFGALLLGIIILVILKELSSIDKYGRSRWGKLSREKYARTMFSMITILTSIILIFYNQYQYIDTISLISLLVAFP